MSASFLLLYWSFCWHWYSSNHINRQWSDVIDRPPMPHIFPETQFYSIFWAANYTARIYKSAIRSQHDSGAACRIITAGWWYHMWRLFLYHLLRLDKWPTQNFLAWKVNIFIYMIYTNFMYQWYHHCTQLLLTTEAWVLWHFIITTVWWVESNSMFVEGKDTFFSIQNFTKLQCSWYTLRLLPMQHTMKIQHCKFIKSSTLVYVLVYILALTNSTEKSPSWEANNHSASQEIPCLSWNLKVHYCIHNGLPIPRLLCNISKKYIFKIHIKYILILSSHLYLSLWRDLFPSGFSHHSILWIFHGPPCPTHMIWLS